MDNKDILESEKGISQGIGQLYLCATPIGNLEDSLLVQTIWTRALILP